MPYRYVLFGFTPSTLLHTRALLHLGHTLEAFGESNPLPLSLEARRTLTALALPHARLPSPQTTLTALLSASSIPPDAILLGDSRAAEALPTLWARPEPLRLLLDVEALNFPKDFDHLLAFAPTVLKPTSTVENKQFASTLYLPYDPALSYGGLMLPRGTGPLRFIRLLSTSAAPTPPFYLLASALHHLVSRDHSSKAQLQGLGPLSSNHSSPNQTWTWSLTFSSGAYALISWLGQSFTENLQVELWGSHGAMAINHFDTFPGPLRLQFWDASTTLRRRHPLSRYYTETMDYHAEEPAAIRWNHAIHAMHRIEHRSTTSPYLSSRARFLTLLEVSLWVAALRRTYWADGFTLGKAVEREKRGVEIWDEVFDVREVERFKQFFAAQGLCSP